MNKETKEKIKKYTKTTIEIIIFLALIAAVIIVAMIILECANQPPECSNIAAQYIDRITNLRW